MFSIIGLFDFTITAAAVMPNLGPYGKYCDACKQNNKTTHPSRSRHHMISNLVFINLAVSEGWGYVGDLLWMFSDLIILLGASFLKIQFVYVLVLLLWLYLSFCRTLDLLQQRFLISCGNHAAIKFQYKIGIFSSIN